MSCVARLAVIVQIGGRGRVMGDAELRRMEEKGVRIGNIELFFLAHETGLSLADGLDESLTKRVGEGTVLFLGEPDLVGVVVLNVV